MCGRAKAGLRPHAAWSGLATSVPVSKPQRRDYWFCYESAAHMVDIFRRFYGPTHKAFLALDDAGKAALEADLIALFGKCDRGNGRGLVCPAEYLEVVATRR